MPVVVIDEILSAFRSAWPTTGAFAGVPIHAHNTVPDQTSDTYAVIRVSETGPTSVESDGLAEQRFRIEVSVYTRRNPPPTASFAASLVLLYDGTPQAPNAGLTLVSGKSVSRCDPVTSSLNRLPERRGGVDVLAAGRVWDVVTNARQGA